MLKKDIELLLPAFLALLSVFVYLRYFSDSYATHWEIIAAGLGAILGVIISRLLPKSRR